MWELARSHSAAQQPMRRHGVFIQGEFAPTEPLLQAPLATIEVPYGIP
jgi:hypothetical protein